jgi:hypothetical protein
MAYKFEDEIDFKDVLTNPTRWFGLYYLLLIVGIVLGGIYYLKNLNYIYMNKVNNSVYMPDSVAIDESASFMIQTASKDIFSSNEDKNAKIVNVVNTIKDSHSDKNWYSSICKLDRVVTMFANNNKWKSNREVFLTMITSNIGKNGFNSNFTELSSDDVNDMYNTLVMLFNTNQNV